MSRMTRIANIIGSNVIPRSKHSDTKGKPSLSVVSAKERSRSSTGKLKVRAIRTLFLVFLLAISVATKAQDEAPASLLPQGPVPATNPEFSWVSLEGTVQYRINVRNAANRAVFNQWYSSAAAGCASGQSVCRIRTGIDFTAESYRWRVLAKDAHQTKSDWSDWQVFYPGQSSAPDAPEAPQTNLPAGSALSNRPDFTWRPVSQGTRYRLKVVNDRNRNVLNRWRTAATLG